MQSVHPVSSFFEQVLERYFPAPHELQVVQDNALSVVL